MRRVPQTSTTTAKHVIRNTVIGRCHATKPGSRKRSRGQSYGLPDLKRNVLTEQAQEVPGGPGRHRTADCSTTRGLGPPAAREKHDRVSFSPSGKPTTQPSRAACRLILQDQSVRGQTYYLYTSLKQ